MEIEYEYRRFCKGTTEPGRMHPDFSFVTPDGDLIIWEHLGLLDRPEYKRGWDWTCKLVRAKRLSRRRDAIHFDGRCRTRPGLC